MTLTKNILAAVLVSATALTAAPALADRGNGHGWRHGGHHGHHHRHHGHHHRGYGHAGAFIGGAIVAGALLSPWYYSPTYHYRPYTTVVEVSPPAPTVYIQQPQAAISAAASDAGNWWYYCNDTRAYYPYVKECASPWQQVAPTPATGVPR